MPTADLRHLIDAYLASDDPLPHEATHVIGDGDFRAIGAEFLGHLVNVGGLTPHDDVLDVGCGFGRIALPLARYLAPTAHYLGFDIVAEPIDWCRRQVAPRHPGFAFTALDLRHPLYNPGGERADAGGFLAQLPQLPWRPSFAFATSVFTHLEEATAARYLAELGALLRPGGKLFLTAFLAGEGAPLAGPGCAFPFAAWRRQGPLIALLGEPLTAAVAIAPQWLFQHAGAAGLVPVMIAPGHWRWGAGVPAASFQDLIVFAKVSAR